MMTQLPQTLSEAEALAFARSDIADVRDGKLALWGLEHGRWFEKDEGRRIHRQRFKHWALADTANMITAVRLARGGWTLADEALREFILECRDRDVPVASISIYLAGFDMDVTAGSRFPKMSGRHKSDQYLRDIIIGFVVFRVSERFNLKPTRNPIARRKPSACSIVTDALRLEGVLFNLTEAAVNKIWRNHCAEIIAEEKLSLLPTA